MLNGEKMDQARREALNQIDKKEKRFKILIVFIALLEGLLLFLLIYNMNWGNDTHLLIFIATLLIYGVLGMGIVALGVFINLNTLKILKAIDVTSS